MTGLVLPGGGARGAFQVGVLKAIAEILPRRCCNPFPIISGEAWFLMLSENVQEDWKVLNQLESLQFPK